jgi:hypothetical protein
MNSNSDNNDENRKIDVSDKKKKRKTSSSNVKKENVQEQQIVGIPLELLKKFRSAFEIANTRVSWNSNELLPVGMILRDIDFIIKSNSKEEKNPEKQDQRSS